MDSANEIEEMLAAVGVAITALQTQLGTKGGAKGSITDLIRLLQLKKELEGERPRHISVRWIDACEPSTEI